MAVKHGYQKGLRLIEGAVPTLLCHQQNRMEDGSPLPKIQVKYGVIMLILVSIKYDIKHFKTGFSFLFKLESSLNLLYA